MADEQKFEYAPTGLTWGGSCEPKSFLYQDLPYYAIPCGCADANCEKLVVAHPTYWQEAFVIGGLLLFGILCAALVVRRSQRPFGTSFQRRTP